MPAPQPDSDWRARWLPVLLWTGVGLVPLAALFLLLGEGAGPLRLAAVLAILSSVLTGLSVALRDDSDSVRLEIEETVLDEVDGIRDQMREDVVAVARKLHGRLRDELAELTEEIEELRAALTRVQHSGMPDLTEEAAAFTRGVVRHTAPVPLDSDQDHDSSNEREPVRAAARATTRWSKAAAVIPAAAIEPPRQTVTTPGRVGRRRAAEPDEPVPAAELEAPRRTNDPWADLREDTQPADVRFAEEWHDSYR